MRLLIFSKFLAEQPSIVAANVNEPCVWISAVSKDEGKTKLPSNSLIKDSLHLFFDDCDPEEVSTFNKLVPMTKEHALEIVEFVKKHKDNVGLICINCQAGLCRSPAVAMAISLWLNRHDSNIPKNYFPNSHVLKMLRDAILETENV